MAKDKKSDYLKAFETYLDLLNKESDRGAVLVSTGYLEELLKEILLSFMMDTSSAKELVDGGNAPLGTFSSRITACYVLGLIDENEHRDLHIVRKVRNDFAHSMHTTFAKDSVKDRCKELHFRAKDYESELMGSVKVPAHGQFVTAAVALIARLYTRKHFAAQEKRTFRFDLKKLLAK